MLQLDAIWTELSAGLQDFLVNGILGWITSLLGALFPQG